MSEVWLSIMTVLKDLQNNNGNVSDQHLSMLNCLLSSNVMDVLYHVDKKTASDIKVTVNSECLYETSPTVLHCSCPSFTYQFLSKKKAFACKHILANYLSKNPKD